jgi:hypothetical protein
MAISTTESNVKSMEISAVIIRKDGTVKNLGVIASWYRNPLVRLWRFLKGA